MKNFILTVLISIVWCNIVFAQRIYPTPTIKETIEAQELAAEFFNRYAETQDVTPLIREFFIKDFGTRLQFCRETDECGGFARDFWGKDDELVKWKAVKVDFENSYSFSINYLYLLFRIVNHIKIIQKNDSGEPEKLAVDKIKNELKDKTELLKYGMFLEDEDKKQSSGQLKNLADFRRGLVKAEELNSELRKLESKLRSEAKIKNPKAKFTYSPTDFRIDIVENTDLFFNYPKGTRIVEVWTESYEDDFLPFKMDLITENGKLKVVAIYPPMD